MAASSGVDARARILVVDDEPQIREVLDTALSEEGYDVRGVANGADALSVVRTWRPDAIVLDLMMPVMNGWQFAEAYGAQPGRRRRSWCLPLQGRGQSARRPTWE